MKVVAYTLLFVVSLLALAVLSVAIFNWQMIPDLSMTAKVKVVTTIAAPVLSVLLIRQKHYVAAGLVAGLGVWIFLWEFTKLIGRF